MGRTFDRMEGSSALHLQFGHCECRDGPEDAGDDLVNPNDL